MATWPSGKARLCKSLIMGSNPIVASKQKEQELSCSFCLSLTHPAKASSWVYRRAALRHPIVASNKKRAGAFLLFLVAPKKRTRMIRIPASFRGFFN
jgi:hypothetical protein